MSESTVEKYKAVEEFERNGETVAVDTELELTAEEAAELGSKVEKVVSE